MKVNELLISIHRRDFDMAKELQIKKYLPIEEKKLIAKGVIYECTEQVDGVIKIDSVQQYLSYVKYMILRHTNLEYTQENYDELCSTEYQGKTLLNAIMDCFDDDAKECDRILNLMVSDRMQEATIEFTVAKFLNKLIDIAGGLYEKLDQKVNDLDLSTIIPKDMDTDKLATFLNTYVK